MIQSVWIVWKKLWKLYKNMKLSYETKMLAYYIIINIAIYTGVIILFETDPSCYRAEGCISLLIVYGLIKDTFTILGKTEKKERK